MTSLECIKNYKAVNNVAYNKEKISLKLKICLLRTEHEVLIKIHLTVNT